MFSTRNQIISFIQQGIIKPEDVDEALSITSVRPDAKSWRIFIDRLLLWFGGLSLACAVTFFIAYNWGEIGRFAKFGLVQCSIVLAIASYWKIGAESLAGKIALLVGAILVGVLLALYGQTYQAGADTWQLFFTWCVLILPWALLGRFVAIWLLWFVLANLSLVLYYQAVPSVLDVLFRSEMDLLWLLFCFNGVALLVWEYLIKFCPWLSPRWALRLLATACGVSITWLALYAIFDNAVTSSAGALVWLAWLCLMYFVYYRLRQDLYMLAGICLSGITVFITFLSYHMLDNLAGGGFLLIALILLGLGAAATSWLKKVHLEWQS